MPVRIAVSGNREVEFSDYTFIQMEKYMKQQCYIFQTSDLIDILRSPYYAIHVFHERYYDYGDFARRGVYDKEVWVCRKHQLSGELIKICPVFMDPLTSSFFTISMIVSREEEERCRLEEWISTLTPLSLQSGNYSEKKSGDKKCEFCYR